MEIDGDQLFDFMQKTTERLGHILASQTAQENHIVAVSHKIDRQTEAVNKKLDSHIGDQGAHGMKASSRQQTTTLGWIAVGVSVVGLIVGFVVGVFAG